MKKTASSITPNLSKLFNHQNISTGQALKIESLINKMMLDCLGSTLYNVLFTYHAKDQNPNTKINIDSLYVLINNAAFFSSKILEKQTLEEWENIISINLTAPYILS